MALFKVGRAGKITLPAALRRQLEIVEGDDLEAEVVEGGLLLRRVTEAERKRAWQRIREAQAIGALCRSGAATASRGRGANDLREVEAGRIGGALTEP